MPRGNYKYALHSTLRGQLERGTGRGYLAALEAHQSEVASIVSDCIILDSRYDQQLESRARYYSKLVSSSKCDLGPIIEHIFANDSPKELDFYKIELAFYCLNYLAWDGDKTAFEAILRYFETGHHWWEAIRCLHDHSSTTPATLKAFSDKCVEDWERVKEHLWMIGDMQNLLAQSLQLTKLAKSLDTFKAKESEGKVITSWNEAIANIDGIDANNFASFRSKIFSFGQKPPKQDIEKFQRSKNPFLRSISYYCYSQFFEFNDIADAFLSDYEAQAEKGYSDLLRNLSHLISYLNDKAVSTAMDRWIESPITQLSKEGESLLKRHSEMRHLPFLLSKTKEYLAAEEEFALCNTLDAIKRIEIIGWLPEVVECYFAAKYSRGRCAAGKVLYNSNSNAFITDYSKDCLWDSNDETVILGIETVDLYQVGVKERIKELCCIDDYSEDVAEAAQEVLNGE